MRILKLIGLLLLAAAILGTPAASNAQIAVGVSVHIGPPALPVYVQPVCPAPGYIWTPGYWAYGEEGYYWVPGTWVMAPQVGFLWTPGYWGFVGGAYAWHAGYWGPHVGFYGGINYGFGYTGVGFVGGEWHGREFAYNRSVTNVNVTVIHNTYNRTVVVNNVNRVSFNGGNGGVNAHATAEEMRAEHEHHVDATHEQMQHEHAASTNRAQFASVNHGRPSVAASAKPGVFSGRDVVAARAENANRPSSNRPSGNASPAGKNVSRNDRPASATNRQASDRRPDTAHSSPGKETRSAPAKSQGNARADRSPAPHGNEKPEHGGKPEKPKS
jgi:WXXGXW repeat (2 copies)